MNALIRLEQPTRQWSLLDSRFYQAWAEGTLPIAAIRTYAGEYGAFIAQIPRAWEAIGEMRIAQTEREHLLLWEQFGESLGTRITSSPEVAEVRNLVEASDRLFRESASAIGALYAFEAQQPDTAQSKLDGLRRHYELPATAATYFAAHTGDDGEATILRERFTALPAAEQERAIEACEKACIALRRALDAIAQHYELECAELQP